MLDYNFFIDMYKFRLINYVLVAISLVLFVTTSVLAGEATGTIGGGDGGLIGPPNAPTGVSAVSGGYTAITVSWNAVTGVDGYKVYRNASDANWESATLATTTNASIISYSDTGLTSAATYYYKIKAYKGGETSSFSSVASVATDSLAVPANLAASVQSTTRIDVSWNAVSGVDGYKLYRNNSLISTQAGLTYSDTGLSSGTAYTYKVKAYLGSVESAFSGEKSATTQSTSSGSGSGSGGGGGGGSSSAPSTVSSNNTPLTVSATQTGAVSYIFPDSSGAKVEVPTGAISAATTFSAAQGTLTSAQTPTQTTGAFMIGDNIFNITAKDASNNLVRNFSGQLTITLSVPELPADTADLAVYYFNDATMAWEKVPGASFDAVNKKVIFSVNHLTAFAVFKATGAPSTLAANSTVSGQVLGEKITSQLSAEVLDYVATQKKLLKTIDKKLTKRLAGRILLQTQDHGEAWYVDPMSQNRFYLADGANAYGALRKFGLGITNGNLKKIPVGIEARFLDVDTDADGLADKLEEGLGTDLNKADTDADGVSDYDEVIKNQTNPLGAGKLTYDNKLLNRLKGRIVLQVESKGEAWYINPLDGKRYYLKDGTAAYQIMRFLSLGVTNADIQKVGIGDL